MGTLHKALWVSEGSGQSRRQRKSGRYEYYVPTPLANLPLSLPADVANDVGNAERAMQNLNAQTGALHSTEGIARLLLRAEAISSSYIEGLSIGARRLLRAEMNRDSDPIFKFDEAAAEVVGNIHAMEEAVASAQAEKVITVQSLLHIHRKLCEGTRIEQFGGMIRDRQNWVGGNSYNPLEAEFIPPAPEYVPGLMDDLAVFCNATDVSPVVQAALAHAQFESIHPFIDGNGRTGRALIHLILKRRGLTPNLVPPISLILATHGKSYVQGLGEFRFVGRPGSPQAAEGISEWISFFAGACTHACSEAQRFEDAAGEMQERWREALGTVRRNSALDLMLREISGMPLFTVATAAETAGRAISSVSAAVDRLVNAGIAVPVKAAKRNRVFEVPDVIDEFNLLERRLASPVGDTAIEKPVRPVPERTRK